MNHRCKALIRVIEQHITLADNVENVLAFFQALDVAGHKGGELEIGAIHPARHLHQADQVDRAFDAIQIFFFETELREEKLGHGRRGVVRHFQADGITEVTLWQFPLDLGAQVFDFFFIHKQIGVTGDAELVATLYRHAAE